MAVTSLHKGVELLNETSSYKEFKGMRVKVRVSPEQNDQLTYVDFLKVHEFCYRTVQDKSSIRPTKHRDHEVKRPHLRH